MSVHETKLTHAARKMMAGVVQIHVEGLVEEDVQTIMNPAVRYPRTWSGSGFFVKLLELEGYIVTNAHVVRNAEKVEISSMLTSEERFYAEIVGLVKILEPDVALLKLNDKELARFKKTAIKEIEYLELHEGNKVSRGEKVKAIGYPMGMVEPNISSGEITNFVSGSEFGTERYVTDAAINPGNSGGPSVNENAKVIGLNTAVIADADNIGFITPANFVKIIIENLIKQNASTFSGLGAKLQKNSERFNPLLKQESAKGLIVSKVDKNGFLNSVGLKQKDVILSLNGFAFDRHGIVIDEEGYLRHKNIYDIIKLIPIGCTVDVKYLRDGKRHQCKGVSMSNPEMGIKSSPILADRKYIEVFGMVIQELNFQIINAMIEIDANCQLEMIKMLDQDHSALVVTHIHQGTQADDMEWGIGQILFKVNEQNVYDIEDLAELIKRPKESHILVECREGIIGYFEIEP